MECSTVLPQSVNSNPCTVATSTAPKMAKTNKLLFMFVFRINHWWQLIYQLWCWREVALKIVSACSNNPCTSTYETEMSHNTAERQIATDATSELCHCIYNYSQKQTCSIMINIIISYLCMYVRVKLAICCVIVIFETTLRRISNAKMGCTQL